MYLIIAAAAVCVISLITFILYGVDKRRAIRKMWRIPERVLLSFSFFGGAVGGICGMLFFRHKSKHWYFSAINVLGLAWQCAALILLACYYINPELVPFISL